MFNFPPLTFWLIVPWPFIWLATGVMMYVIHKRQDDFEEEYKSK